MPPCLKNSKNERLGLKIEYCSRCSPFHSLVNFYDHPMLLCLVWESQVDLVGPRVRPGDAGGCSMNLFERKTRVATPLYKSLMVILP